MNTFNMHAAAELPFHVLDFSRLYMSQIPPLLKIKVILTIPRLPGFHMEH